MTAFFTALWMAIAGFFGFAGTEVERIEPAPVEQQVPTGTPGSSTPRAAIEACVAKSESDECSFELNDSDIKGVCVERSKTLACEPVFE